jgi:hypothetical protein
VQPQIGWSNRKRDTGFLTPHDFASPDFACHKNWRNADSSAPVSAGGTIKFKWDTINHPGDVITYLANCRGPCETVKPDALRFFKIEESGLLRNGRHRDNGGYWAINKLYDDANSWTVTLPTDIVPGNYVIRHEAIALQFADNPMSSQHYIFCASLQINGGGGSVDPSGLPASQLYDPEHPGLHLNIRLPNCTVDTYQIPGPPLYNKAGAGAGTGGGASTAAAASSYSTPLGVSSSSAAPSTTVDAVPTNPTSSYVSNAPTTMTTTTTPYLSLSSVSVGPTSYRSSTTTTTTSSSSFPSSSSPVAPTATSSLKYTQSPSSPSSSSSSSSSSAPSSTTSWTQSPDATQAPGYSQKPSSSSSTSVQAPEPAAATSSEPPCPHDRKANRPRGYHQKREAAAAAAAAPASSFRTLRRRRRVVA